MSKRPLLKRTIRRSEQPTPEELVARLRDIGKLKGLQGLFYAAADALEVALRERDELRAKVVTQAKKIGRLMHDALENGTEPCSERIMREAAERELQKVREGRIEAPGDLFTIDDDRSGDVTYAALVVFEEKEARDDFAEILGGGERVGEQE